MKYPDGDKAIWKTEFIDGQGCITTITLETESPNFTEATLDELGESEDFDFIFDVIGEMGVFLFQDFQARRLRIKSIEAKIPIDAEAI